MSDTEKLIEELQRARAYCEKHIEDEYIGFLLDGAIEKIEELSALYKNKNMDDGWIPCSEKSLPLKKEVIISTKKGIVDMGTIWNNTVDCGDIVRDKQDILAWQPAPNPYKGE